MNTPPPPATQPTPADPFISFADAIDEAGLLAFEEKFFAGELTPTLKSEEPSDEDLAEPVKVLKGKSFSKVVLENGELRGGGTVSRGSIRPVCFCVLFRVSVYFCCVFLLHACFYVCISYFCLCKSIR